MEEARGKMEEGRAESQDKVVSADCVNFGIWVLKKYSPESQFLCMQTVLT